jgi:hypothetical protein
MDGVAIFGWFFSTKSPVKTLRIFHIYQLLHCSAVRGCATTFALYALKSDETKTISDGFISCFWFLNQPNTCRATESETAISYKMTVQPEMLLAGPERLKHAASLSLFGSWVSFTNSQRLQHKSTWWILLFIIKYKHSALHNNLTLFSATHIHSYVSK